MRKVQVPKIFLTFLLFIIYQHSFSQWRSLPVRSKAEFDAQMPGGEGEQYPQGFSRCLDHPEYVYAAQDVGGCWRSADGGISWKKTLDKGLYLPFGQSIEVDPVNPDLVMMVVDNTYMVRGSVDDYQGIYRSEDGGGSWEQVLNTPTVVVRRIRHLLTYSLSSRQNNTTSPTRWYAVFDNNGLYRSDNSGKKDSWVLKAAINSSVVEVVAHPLSNDTVYVAAYDGLYRSTNGGADLTKWRFSGKVVTSVLVSPKIPDQMYVCVSGDGIYHSANGGQTFNKILINSGGVDQSAKISHAVLNAGFPEQIFAMGDNNIKSTWVTNDAGNTWQALPLATTFPGLGRETGWRRWIDGDFSFICPNPKDKSQAVATARSTFFQINNNNGLLGLSESAAGFTGNAAAWWSKCIAFHPYIPDIFALFCFDVGPRVTSTGGNWFHEQDPKITTWKYTNQITQWTGSYSGCYQPLEGSKVVVASIGLYNGKSQLMRSSNYGITWDNVVTVVNGDTQTNLQGYEFVGFDPQMPNIVYAGNRISKDAGLTFQPIVFPENSLVNGSAPCVYGLSQDFSGNSFVFALNANMQKIYRSDDHGSTWFLFASLGDIGSSAKFMDGLPTITPHPTNPNVVFTLDASRDLLKVVYDPVTKIAGYTSLKVFNSLPAGTPEGVKSFMQIRMIAIDPGNPKVMYVSTNISGIPSVYRSLDGGVTWQSISDDFPHLPGVPVVNPHTGEVYRGSMNGTWIYPAPPAPVLPISNAGVDQTVNEGGLVTLDGSASTDPGNGVLSYVWSAPAGITLSSTAAAKPGFTAPEVSSDTEYAFSLTVNNGTLRSVSDQVIVTVKQVNKPPVANAGSDQRVKPGALVTLDGSASSDPDNDGLSYLWTAPEGITLNSASTPNPTFTAPEVSTNTDYTFSLKVNDGQISSLVDQVVITVKASDQKMSIYPNPTKGRITIEFDQVYGNGAYLTLHDLNGKELLKKFIFSREEFIDLTGYAPGIYLINTNLKNIDTQKIILFH